MSALWTHHLDGWSFAAGVAVGVAGCLFEAFLEGLRRRTRP